MEFNTATQAVPNLELPDGYSWIEWNPSLIDAHATVKASCFSGEIDSTVFPCLGNFSGCQRLMRSIAAGSTFLPEATWLIKHPSDIPSPAYCGTIQGMLRSNRLGSIQNIGITPDCRGIGLGKAIVARSLIGFVESGASRVYLDVTAANYQAVALYHSLGFRILETSYLAVASPELAETTS